MAKLDPFIPTIGDPWNTRKAAHLARRAGFGATPAELAALVAGSPGAAVDALVDYPDLDAASEAEIANLGSFLAAPTNHVELAGQWFVRMRFTGAPLQEQLTLFWHDHFATQFEKLLGGIFFYDSIADLVQKATDLLANQNNLFRVGGIKDFRALLLDETRDPAMLIFLDNWLNRKAKPQENYARELLELFSMGPGNYSEDEVQDVAKALSGETMFPFSLSYIYVTDIHNNEPKTLFGETFNFPDDRDTEKVIDLILANPATATFMARKLIAWFVNGDPDPDAVTELAAELGSNGFDFREALRKLFKSQYFYEESNIFSIYKTPIDFGIHLIRQLEFTQPLPGSIDPPLLWVFVAFLTRDIGMALFEPPNVGGWIPGSAWINSSSVINRFNLAELISLPQILTDALVDTYFAVPTAATNDEIVDTMRDRLIQDTLRPGERGALLAQTGFLDGFLSAFGLGPDVIYREKARALAHVICATPKYQLK